MSKVNRGGASSEKTLATPTRTLTTLTELTRPLAGFDYGAEKNSALCTTDGHLLIKSLGLPSFGDNVSKFVPAVIGAMYALGYDVIIEASAIKSSRVEIADLLALRRDNPGAKLFIIPSRAVNIHRKDIGKPYPSNKDGKKGKTKESNAEDAAFILEIGSDLEKRYEFTGERIQILRLFRSPRPMDGRGYRDKRSLELLAKLPAYDDLPPDMKDSPISLNGEYRRRLAVAFAASLCEPYLDLESGPLDRVTSRYERLTGFSFFGKNCYYRKVREYWMRHNAEKFTGEKYRNGNIPKFVRKEAWRTTTWEIRRLFHICAARIRPDYPKFDGKVVKPPMVHKRLADEPSPATRLRGA